MWILKHRYRNGKVFYTPVLTELQDKKPITVTRQDKTKFELMTYKVKGLKEYLWGGVFSTKEESLEYSERMNLKIW